MKTPYLLIVVGLAVAGCGNPKFVSGQPQDVTENRPAHTVKVTNEKGVVVGESNETPIAIKDSDLWEAYGANEISADAKYTGKYVKLVGAVCDIAKINGKYQVGVCARQARVNGPLFATVSFTIRPGEEAKFSKVEINQGIEVIAKVVGRKSSSRASEGYVVMLEDARYVRHGLIR